MGKEDEENNEFDSNGLPRCQCTGKAACITAAAAIDDVHAVGAAGMVLRRRGAEEAVSRFRAGRKVIHEC
jgi:hypothetical protein